MSGTGQMGGTTYFPPSVLDGQAVPGGEVQVEILPPEEAPAGQALGDGGGGGAMQGGAGGIADTPRNATGAPQEAAPPAPAPEAPATPPVAPAPAPVAAAPVVAGDVADSYRAYRDAADQARQEAELRRRVQRRQPRNAPAIVGSAAAADAPADGAPPAAMADASGAVPRPRPRRRDSAASAAQAQEPAEVVPPMPDEPGIGARILQAAGTVARNGADGMLQIPGGVIRGVREVFRAADDVANWLNNNVADLRIDVPGLPAPLGNPAAAMAEVVDGLNPIPEPRTPTGRITGEVAQFLSGFLRGNGLLRATGVMQGAGAGAAAGRAAAAGAIADFFFQESGEQNLAAAWRAAGLPENALTEFLATDPNDNAAVNRLR
ncbi:MAG: hypothetical protein IT555_11010, partial [Acetobacteraceae bacterium]|nr:hypothetical protein [Acetobacteraceae bacterium]